MDANQLALDILAFLNENLALISHKKTCRNWDKAFKRIAPVLEEKAALDKVNAKKSEGSADFSALSAQDRNFCLEIAQMRLETMLRDQYEILLTRQDKRLSAVMARMSANNQKGKDPNLKPWTKDGLTRQNKKLMDIVRKDHSNHSLLRADLYMFIAYIQKAPKA